MKSKDLENKIKEYEHNEYKLKEEIRYLSSKVFNIEYENNFLKEENNYLKLTNKKLNGAIDKVKYNLMCSIESINMKIFMNRNNYGIDRINDYRLVRLRAFRQKSKEILKMLGGV